MRQGTTQFFYCCPTNFAKQYKLVMKSLKKQGGQLLSLTEETDVKPGWVKSAKEWGFHSTCINKPKKRGRPRQQDLTKIMRCTVTYEVP